MQINLTYSCNRSCSYCYVKGFLGKWPKGISLQGLETIFKWIVKQRIRDVVNFSGGEPTLFGEINSALGLAEKYGLKITISTNGTTNLESINIKSPAISSFGVTLNPPSKYSSQELKTLYSNLKVFKKNFKRVIFRFNITSPDVSYDYLINACERLNIRYVDFALTFPSVFNQNEYVRKENFKDLTQYILRFVKDLSEHGIRGDFDEPFPLCFFSEKERIFLTKHSKLHGVCGAGKCCVITPNLTVFPCSALAIEGPPLDMFKSQEKITDYYKEIIEKLKWEIDLFPECKECSFKRNKQCHGSCLSYKLLQAKDPVKLINENSKPSSRD